MRRLAMFLMLTVAAHLGGRCAWTQTYIFPGYVSGTWNAAGSPYIIMGTITVHTDSILTIESGVQVKFQGYYSLDVNGFLEAVGNEADSIYFTRLNETIVWKGIRFFNAPDSSHLFFCIIEYGHVEDGSGGGLYLSNSNPVISHCTIRNNWAEDHGGGIYCDLAGPTISYTNISNNSTHLTSGGGINCQNSNLMISHCTINGNYADNNGGGICFGNSNAIINYSVISNNTDEYSGGGIYSDLSNLTIDHCTFAQNSVGSTIYEGGGIAADNSSLTTVNTIFFGNYSGDPGCIYLNNCFNCSIWYCDFYANVGGNFGGNSLPPVIGVPIIANANGDTCDLYYNIFEDPLFEDPGNGNFQITWENWPIWDDTRSACIDAGNPASPSDPDSTIADIGAFYFHQGPIIVVSSDSLNFGSVVVGSQSYQPLTIFNIGGGTLVLYNIYTSEPFTTTFNPDSNLVASGDSLEILVYFSPTAIALYDEILTIENNDTPVTVSLQGIGTGSDSLGVHLTPHNPPIVIPETGGNFNFNIEVQNWASSSRSFDIWTQIELPGTGVVPILTVTGLTLPGNAAVDRDRTQEVPGIAPAGTYTYHAYIGTYPWVIDSTDTFTFQKLGTEGVGSLGSPSHWRCTGEGFEAWLAYPEMEIPNSFAFDHAYPNPFNPTTTLLFDMPSAGTVKLLIYDISGRPVAELVNGWRGAGRHQVTFDASHLASGLYIARLQAGDFIASQKMVLVK